MNSKIKSYSALAMAASAVIPMACKKNEVNDPNITDKTIYKSIVAVQATPLSNFIAVDSIDVDGNGLFDMGFVIGVNLNDSSATAYCVNPRNLSQVLTDGSNVLKIVAEETSIDSNSTTWQNLGLIHQKNLASSTNIGIGGQGDKFIAFRFRSSDTSSDIYNGWMKVNLSADLKIFIVKELAYPNTPNTAIKAGAK